MDWSEVAVVVPARLASTRLHEKLLQPIAGRPLLARTLDALQTLPLPEGHLAVATGDPPIRRLATQLGVRVLATPRDLPSGTHRVAVASASLPPSVRWVINVQGDEPLLDPAVVHAAMAARTPTADGVTAACPLTESEWLDPDTVKAIVDAHGRAMWFTRAPEPYRLRNLSPADRRPTLAGLPNIQRHLGIYGFRRDKLAQWPMLPDSPLAVASGLEQLAPLAAGWTFQVATVPRPIGPAVDTAADLEAVRSLFASTHPD